MLAGCQALPDLHPTTPLIQLSLLNQTCYFLNHLLSNERMDEEKKKEGKSDISEDRFEVQP